MSFTKLVDLRLVLLMFVFSTPLFAQTPLAGIYANDLTLGIEDSPYLIDGDLTMWDYTILKIEPGVVIEVEPNKTITIRGYIEAIGTETDSIYFKSANPELYWAGLSFLTVGSDYSGLTGNFEYCVIEECVSWVMANSDDASTSTYDRFRYENCHFRGGQSLGEPENGPYVYKNCNFEGLVLGPTGVTNQCTVEYCAFKGNTVACTGMQVVDCHFEENEDAVLGQSSVRRSTFLNNGRAIGYGCSKAIASEFIGNQICVSAEEIVGNYFLDNNSLFAISNNTSQENLRDNTICENADYSIVFTSATSGGDIRYNCFCGMDEAQVSDLVIDFTDTGNLDMGTLEQFYPPIGIGSSSVEPIQVCAGETVSIDFPLEIAGADLAWVEGQSTAAQILSPTESFTLEYQIESTYGCSEVKQLEIEVAEPPIFDLGESQLFCSGDVVQLSGPENAQYQWSQGSSLQQVGLSNSGWYSLLATRGSCSVSDSVYIESVDCQADLVFPGDCNHDMVANNFDFLSIGLGYGFTGPERPAASLDWQGQLAFDFDSVMVSGLNYKHVDSDGNGLIDLEDAEAIDLNYGLTHQNGKTVDEQAEGYEITLELPENVEEGQAISIPIQIGTEEEPIEGFYGLAFSVFFQSNYLEEGSISLNFSDSWLGVEDQDFISFYRVFHEEGRIDVAVTLINHQNISGYGDIGVVETVMDNDIQGKLQLDFVLSVSRIKGLSANETELEFANTEFTAPVDGPANINRKDVQLVLYPNPGDGLLFFQSSEEVDRFEVYDLQGRMLHSTFRETQQSQLFDLSMLKDGVYLVCIQMGNSVHYQRIRIAR